MVFSKLFANRRSEKEERQNQIAVAALLFQMVRVDGQTDAQELKHMRQLLTQEFKLSESEVVDVFGLANDVLKEKKSLEELTESIREDWGNSRRIRLVEFLWVLAYADDKIDNKEKKLVHQVADLLTLTEYEQAQAQENAELRLGLHDF